MSAHSANPPLSPLSDDEYHYSDVEDDEYQYSEEDEEEMASVQSNPNAKKQHAADSLSPLGSGSAAKKKRLSPSGLGHAGSHKQQEYHVIDEEELLQEQRALINEIAQVLEIPAPVASVLLRYFGWNKEKLFEGYYADPATTKHEAGVEFAEKPAPVIPKDTTATEAHRLKFFAFAKEQQDQLFPEGVGRRMDDTFDLVGHRHIMLRDTTLQIISAMKDWETAKNDSIGAYLIDGERGTGKSFALHQIVQYARESNWVVLYIPNPRSWTNEAPYVMQSPYQEGKFDIDVYGVDLLQKFLHCHGEQLKSIPLRGKYADRYYPTDKYESKPKNAADYKDAALTLRDVVVGGVRDEELACQAVCDLKEELAQTTEFPVLIAIDDYNTWFQPTVFGYEGKDVAADDISVIAALKDIGAKGYNESRKLKNGLFVAAATENFPTKVHFKQQVDYRKIRATMRTYTPEELSTVVSYYNQVSFLHGASLLLQFCCERCMLTFSFWLPQTSPRTRRWRTSGS
ncbi:COP9 signalosome complex subunit 1 [Phytophthora nicotianae]|uniref:Small ribosomal subunit protein mS29 n=1 Tax=Phytophthora nicotianae TaxID=4792 RepID=A0A0W8DF35_PHYNI|nr:COP9 signalosome complex subunit 1 [Phytophthora nicotianae]